ncbi:MAG: Gfo/Idh/MocA family oxidoreductase [Armatimonadetes bacterium]|nr:Gfo/Idh/MocA family oxidoreductase [Armatimonadota bacterium]
MDQITVGILGLRRGITHLHNFLTVPEARVIAAADRLPDRQAEGRRLLEPVGGKMVAEFEELLAMQPDAVVVASNGRMQCQHACQALEAGCHVLSEVPGAFTLEEWVRIRDTVQRTGNQYMLGENCSFLNFIRYWRKWIAAGQYGEMSLAEAEYLHYLPHTLTNADGRFFTPSEARQQGLRGLVPTWRADQPPIQYLTHDLGPLLEVLDDRVMSVTCRSGPWRCPEAPLRPDGQIALFTTEKGLLIQILVTLNTVRPSEHRYRLFGTGGSLEWSWYEGFCRRFLAGMEESKGWERVDIAVATSETDKQMGHGGMDVNLARHFVWALHRGKTVPIDVYRSIEYSLPGIIAAQSADLGGTPLAVPDLRLKPFRGTAFWDYVGFPEDEPEGRPMPPSAA